MSPGQALDYVRQHGIVLASARGALPRLAEVVAGEAIQGSWWAHPKGRLIFQVLQSLQASPEILVCRIVDGKICFVHRRLWPALVRLAPRFPVDRLARITQVHTARGHHENRETAFPDWVPADVSGAAQALSQEQAMTVLGDWLPALGARRRKADL